MEFHTGSMAARDTPPAASLRPQDRATYIRQPAGPVSDKVFPIEAKVVMVAAPIITFLLVAITLLLAFGGLNLTAHVQDLAVKCVGGIAGVIGGCQLISAGILGKYYHDQQKVIERRHPPATTPPAHTPVVQSEDSDITGLD